MKYIVNSRQMKAYDKAAAEMTGIPSLVLMERAAGALAGEIIRRFSCSLNGKKSRVLILAGSGNNGGDGFAAGRILEEYGYPVSYVLAGERTHCSGETDTQIRILENLGVLIGSSVPEGEFDVIVDALLGIGLNRAVTGRYAEMIGYINASSAFVVSADIPSGIHADTGTVMGVAVAADLTVTFGYAKLGLVLYPGASCAGETVCKRIGITYREGLEKPAAFLYDREDLARLPIRKEDGNKGSFGKVFVIAGNERMYGACQFAVLGAYRVGAGLVRVLTGGDNRIGLMQGVPEAIVDTYGADFPGEALEEGLNWADCVVIGPGIGTKERACRIMEYVWKHCRLPLVVDADGLNILAVHPEWIREGAAGRPVYFTPHMGEFSRLTKKNIKCCKEDILSSAAGYAAACQVILVCKDARTVVADPAGQIYINTSGDNGMATGGSGDVLSGMLSGLLAQGMQGMEAASMAVYLHGLAGNRASAEKTAYSVMARDLLDALPQVLAEKQEFCGTGRGQDCEGLIIGGL